MSQIITPEQAEMMLRDVTARYGTPVYIAHIPSRIRKLVPYETRMEILSTAEISEGWRGAAREAGRDEIIRFARENLGAILTVKQIAEIGGVSESIARDVIRSNPRLFRKSEGRSYECRGDADL